MNKTTSTLLISSALLATSAVAGVPLNGLQGDGGIAFNPVAFVAGTYAEESQTISAPQVGTWYTRLDSADIDWAAASASFSIEKRLELSYGYGWTDANKYGDDSVSTHNLGAKLVLVAETLAPAKAVAAAWVHMQGGVYVIVHQGLIVSEAVLYRNKKIVRSCYDECRGSVRCDVLVARPVDALFIGRVVTEELAA